MQINGQKNDDFEGNGIPEVIVRAERDKNSGITASRRNHVDRERRKYSFERKQDKNTGGNRTPNKQPKESSPQVNILLRPH
jgi:hypothetical protein